MNSRQPEADMNPALQPIIGATYQPTKLHESIVYPDLISTLSHVPMLLFSIRKIQHELQPKVCIEPYDLILRKCYATLFD